MLKKDTLFGTSAVLLKVWSESMVRSVYTYATVTNPRARTDKVNVSGVCSNVVDAPKKKTFKP
jgi:hypothetical protein